MFEPLLQVCNVSHRYGNVSVFEGLSLSLNVGEVLAIQGPSGCGKTTLLRLIASDPPTSGEVLIAGRSVVAIDPYAREIASLYQGAQEAYLERTPMDMIRFALQKRADRTSKESASKLYLHRLQRMVFPERAYMSEALLLADAVRLPRAKLAQRLRELSGGERQRAMLARVLAEQPRLLLADEPLANLDRTLKLSLAEELRDFFSAHRMSVLYVTHDTEEAGLVADRTLHFERLRRP